LREYSAISVLVRSGLGEITRALYEFHVPVASSFVRLHLTTISDEEERFFDKNWCDLEKKHETILLSGPMARKSGWALSDLTRRVLDLRSIGGSRFPWPRQGPLRRLATNSVDILG
jgi:hypothetical protein